MTSQSSMPAATSTAQSDTRSDARAPAIAREGWPIIGAIVAGAIVLSMLGSLLNWTLGAALSGVGFVVSAWAVWFFRDPARAVPQGAGLFVSPADGVVCAVALAPLPPEIRQSPADDAPRTRVSVFMNIFNVHVNRAPEGGVIDRVRYTPGKFFNASLDKASEHNERCALAMRSNTGDEIVFVQIAGLVARRIVCRVDEGARLERGERFGIIRFGSRVDLYLPPGAEPVVATGQRVTAGETVLARFPDERS